MKLYRCMHDIEMMCHKQGRQLLLVWFLNYLPLTFPYSKPCLGHNYLTLWNIFMKLYRCMHEIETMCHEQGRQLLLVWFLNYLSLTFPYSKPCPGHSYLTIWNIFMKLYRCMHDIEMMCREKGRQLLLVWFLNYLPLT